MLDKLLEFFPLFTLVADILLAVFLLYWFLFKNKINNKIKYFFKKNGLFLAFIFSLLATAGSLLYSEYALYSPCKLCWYQRIFMYPQVVILAIAVWKKHFSVKLYSIALSIIGSLIAIYHYLTQRFPDFIITKCAIGEVDCSFNYGFDYGYITIPIMALTAFIFIIIFMAIWDEKKLN